jgi:hypothetical protein
MERVEKSGEALEEPDQDAQDGKNNQRDWRM